MRSWRCIPPSRPPGKPSPTPGLPLRPTIVRPSPPISAPLAAPAGGECQVLWYLRCRSGAARGRDGRGAARRPPTCPHCGAEVTPEDAYCTQCGVKLEEEPAPEETPTE